MGRKTHLYSTYPKALREVVAMMPREQILAETDSPYLSPIPHRGKRNEPAYITLVVQQLAEIRSVSLQEMADTIMDNVRRLFGIG